LLDPFTHIDNTSAGYDHETLTIAIVVFLTDNPLAITYGVEGIAAEYCEWLANSRHW
jgi:hypothetical protein